MRNFNYRQNEFANVSAAIFPRAVLERKALGLGIMWVRRLTLHCRCNLEIEELISRAKVGEKKKRKKPENYHFVSPPPTQAVFANKAVSKH